MNITVSMKDGNMQRIFIPVSALAVLTVFASGCWNNVDSVQQAHPAYSNVPYGPAFENSFTNCAWKTIAGEGNKKQVQFEGRISSELHAFALGKLNTASQVTLFNQACAYLGALIKIGKAAGDSLITFDIAGYPINPDGSVKTEQLGAFLDEPGNRKAVLALEEFYRKRFWEQDSPVVIVFNVSGIKEAKIVKVSNHHWDVDPQCAGKPEDLIAMIYEFIKPLLSVE